MARVLLTAAVAAAGGWCFALLSAPLPWMLGAMAAVLAGKAGKLPVVAPPDALRNAALVALGIVFGLQFTRSTWLQVGPYVGPYLGVTAATIAICIGLGALFAVWAKIDKVSSVFGFMPGGLTEMVVTGEAVGAKPGTVIFLQTTRLLSVLAVVPFLVTMWFAGNGGEGGAPLAAVSGAEADVLPGATLAWLWYALPAAAAWALRRIVPGSFVLIPMLGTALLHLSGTTLHPIPPYAMLAAQVVVGAGLGYSVRLKELRAVGKQWWRACALVAAMLAASFAMGIALHALTSMDLPTALLSVAPGGTIEMGLTAASVGADPAVVTSLQMVRVYTIIFAAPLLLKRWFGEQAAGV